jgi:protein-S-isoprenylcysteine O-methyltransferase Ste14
MKLLSLLGYLSMVGGLLLLIAMHSLLSPSPVVIVVQACGTALALWARVTFGRRSFHLAANPTEGGLVTTGPYRFIRHPIYTGIVLIVTASLASHLSWSASLAASLVFGGTLLRIYCEETLVVQRYPEYREYQTKTWRMIPFLF